MSDIDNQEQGVVQKDPASNSEGALYTSIN
jgi:hypothetical protein